MNPLLIRFHSILTVLAGARRDREAFRRLVADRPTGIRIRVRSKTPQADLRLSYGRNIGLAGLGTALFLMGGFLALPDLRAGTVRARAEQMLVTVEDIPETRQVVRPAPPPRPAVPIETESDDVPDDVTIESTDLNLDQVSMDIPPPPDAGAGAPIEDDPVEYWAVEQKPQIVHQVPPAYPDVARRSGVEGDILLRVLVGKDGLVKEAEVVRGQELFHDAALKAIYQYRFEPAMQNDRPVPVWLAMPIRFRLVS